MAKRFVVGFVLLTVVAIFSCKKMEASNVYTKNDCTKFSSIEIITPKVLCNVGDTISLAPSIANMTNVLYTWIDPDGNSTISPLGFGILNCQRENEGMYYLVCSDNDCGTIKDSVYITVVNKADTPTCVTYKDSISFSTIPNSTYTVTRQIDTATNKLSLYAKSKIDSTYPSFTILFHNRWAGKEPQDGLYTTTADSTILTNVANRYQVFISSLYNNAKLKSRAGDAVYISHSSGRLVVTFCNVNLAGFDNMSNYIQTVAQGNIEQP